MSTIPPAKPKMRGPEFIPANRYEYDIRNKFVDWCLRKGYTPLTPIYRSYHDVDWRYTACEYPRVYVGTPNGPRRAVYGVEGSYWRLT